MGTDRIVLSPAELGLAPGDAGRWWPLCSCCYCGPNPICQAMPGPRLLGCLVRVHPGHFLLRGGLCGECWNSHAPLRGFGGCGSSSTQDDEMNDKKKDELDEPDETSNDKKKDEADEPDEPSKGEGDKSKEVVVPPDGEFWSSYGSVVVPVARAGRGAGEVLVVQKKEDEPNEPDQKKEDGANEPDEPSKGEGDKSKDGASSSQDEKNDQKKDEPHEPDEPCKEGDKSAGGPRSFQDENNDQKKDKAHEPDEPSMPTTKRIRPTKGRMIILSTTGLQPI